MEVQIYLLCSLTKSELQGTMPTKTWFSEWPHAQNQEMWTETTLNNPYFHLHQRKQDVSKLLHSICEVGVLTPTTGTFGGSSNKGLSRACT